MSPTQFTLQLDRYASFLVRVWEMEGADGVEPVVCGEVQSVQSGETWHFTRFEEVLAFLRERARQIQR